jgi:tRNA threonylcarbamoyladenosine biosynthesis protein TsaE
MRPVASFRERDFTIITKSPEETVKFGSDLSAKLNDKDIIALYGDLGSGKTQIVKGICLGLGVKDTVNSPTFIIVNEYSSDKFKNIFHFDLYRMKTEDEIINIGFDDYMNSRGIILIEWPEHIERILPHGTIKIHLAHSVEDENHRFIRLENPSL